ncbi:MAG: phage minor head protein [Alsobacter sp.]
MTETLDAVLRYAVRLEGLSARTVRLIAADIDAALADVDAEIEKRLGQNTATASRLRTLRVELQRVRAALRASITGDLAEALAAVEDTTATLAADLSDDLHRVAGVAVATRSVEVPLSIVRAAAGEFDGRSWTAWGEALADDTIDRIEAELRRAIAKGETLPAIRDRLSRVTGLARTGAERLARTSISATANAGRRAAVESLAGDLPFRWKYVATLDSRTSIICASLDGREWASDDPDIPRPPRHPSCRSTLVPVIGEFTGERAAEGGPVAASENFETWLRRQPDAFQDEVLGPTKADAWRAGVPLSDMATASRELTVAELRRLYPDKVPA